MSLSIAQEGGGGRGEGILYQRGSIVEKIRII